MDLLALLLMVAAALAFFVATANRRLAPWFEPAGWCLFTVGYICQWLHPTTLVG